jgi:AcrR family transcriptional regulator
MPTPARRAISSKVTSGPTSAKAVLAASTSRSRFLSPSARGRRAGVGIGTLYRHFPTRDAIVEAVYRREVEQLALSASRLLDSLPPGEALHAWMQLFVDYIGTKKLIASALSAIVGGTTDLFASSGTRITDAIALLVQRAAAAGEIRAGVDPLDLLYALVGICYGRGGPEWQASALRLIDILMDGLRHR